MGPVFPETCMHYLLFAILCSSAIALVLKYSESRNLNRLAVTNINYAVATLVSLFFVLQGRLLERAAPVSVPGFAAEAHKLVQGGLFTDGSSLVWAILVGSVGGILYFVGLISIQKSIRENGVGITGAFSKIGIFIPMVLSMVLWRELPSVIQWAGIALAIGAIGLANYSPMTNALSVRWRTSLVLVFTVVGLSEFSNKLFQHYADVAYKALFLLTVFVVAYAISLGALLLERSRFTRKDVLVGILVGVPNMFTSFFLISALNHLKTAVAFPLYSAGTIVVINIGGLLLFKERMERKDLAATFLTIGAVVLMGV